MRAADADIPYGTLDLMVLKTLAAMGPLHGYGIARRIEHVAQGMLALNQGTIYPALLRLGQKGTVVAGAREACTVGRCGKRDGVRLRRSGFPAEVRLVFTNRSMPQMFRFVPLERPGGRIESCRYVPERFRVCCALLRRSFGHHALNL